MLRRDSSRGGVEALKATVAPGPPPVETEAALRVVTPSADAPVADQPNIARLRAEARAGVKISRSQLSKAICLPLAATPAHAERLPNFADEIERVGLRLQLRKRGRQAGDIVLLYGDASEALTHPIWRGHGPGAGRILRGAGAGPGQEGGDDRLARPPHPPTHRAHQPDQAQQRLYRSPRAARPPLRPEAGTSDDTGRAGRGQRADPRQQALCGSARRPQALAHRRVGPEIRTELNDIEVVWHDLKAHHLAHQTFNDTQALDR